jgi:hypothetical protein
MELIKKFKVVIGIVLITLILVFIRSTGTNHFKNDAKKWADPSVKQSNTISLEQAQMLKGENLIISLDKESVSISGINGETLKIPADSILSKNNLNLIRKHDGKVLIVSSEPGLSARIWMILSQMGCRNVYILSNTADNEVLKFKFQPDSLSSAL